MPAKRKFDEVIFDPNKSDPEDENYSPDGARPAKVKKRTKSRHNKPPRTKRRNNGYGGSDLEDDDGDSDGTEDSLGGGGSYDEPDESEDNGAVGATGRRVRKA